MPRNTAVRGHADKADMPEFLTLFRVGQMDFDNGDLYRFDRVVERDGGVGVGAGIQKHRFRALGLCLMQPVDQMAFMVGLAKIDLQPQFLRLVIEAPGDIVERIGPVNFRFAHTEQVEIGAIEDIDKRICRQS